MSDPPIEDKYRTLMNDIGYILDDSLNEKGKPKKIGFAILMFDFEDNSRMNWISNANRQDMISALREAAAKLEGMAPDQEGHA